MSETQPPELVTVYYIAEERAMAPGIAGGYDAWPQTIPAPHTKNGRLSKLPKEFGDDIAKAAAYDEIMRRAPSIGCIGPGEMEIPT